MVCGMPGPGPVRRQDVIDPGDQATWPADVLQRVHELDRRCREVGDNASDPPAHELRLMTVDAGHDEEELFRTQLDDRMVSLFHATRLLPHELLSVTETGLFELTVESRSDRLDRVIAAYGSELGTQRLEALREAGPLRDQGHREGRLGMLWGVTPIHAFRDEDAGDGLMPFLEHWGGETFYWAADESEDIAATLTALTERSTPCVIEVAVRPDTLNTYTSLWRVFVGVYGNWRSPWHEFNVSAAIPAGHILEVIKPTSERWPYGGPPLHG
jgi:hypothetical protein